MGTRGREGCLDFPGPGVTATDMKQTAKSVKARDGVMYNIVFVQCEV